MKSSLKMYPESWYTVAMEIILRVNVSEYRSLYIVYICLSVYLSIDLSIYIVGKITKVCAVYVKTWSAHLGPPQNWVVCFSDCLKTIPFVGRKSANKPLSPIDAHATFMTENQLMVHLMVKFSNGANLGTAYEKDSLTNSSGDVFYLLIMGK